MSKKNKLEVKKFGRLTVVADSGRRDSRGNVYWDCICECGNESCTTAYQLKSGKTHSCGCYNKEQTTKHGMAGTKVYMAWAYMKNRCNNKNNTEYHNYGGRGIIVCERWKIFSNFYEDMGDKPTEKHELDRIDTNGNYEPNNCRWVTRSINSHNTRSQKGSTSKYKGVYFRKDTKKWVAKITKDGEIHTIGCFKKERQAALAYNYKAIELYGKNASLNKLGDDM